MNKVVIVFYKVRSNVVTTQTVLSGFPTG